MHKLLIVRQYSETEVFVSKYIRMLFSSILKNEALGNWERKLLKY